MAFVHTLTPEFRRRRTPNNGPPSATELRASVRLGGERPWRMLAGSVAAALVGAVAVTAFVRGGPPERERYYQAGIAEPTTTGSIELRH